MSLRKFAKAVLFHARRAHIRSLTLPRQVPWLRRSLRLPVNTPYEPLHDSPPAGVILKKLDDAGTFVRPLPLLPAAPVEAARFYSARSRETTGPSYVAEFRDGIAWGHPTGGIFTPACQFVPAFTHDPAGAAQHSVWRRLHLPRPQLLLGRTLYLVTPEATDNFHHWLIDLLPRLGLVRRAGFDLAGFDHVIVNHADRGYQWSTLEHLGIQPEKVVTADESLFARCESLVVPSLKANHQNMPAADLAFLRESFLPARPLDRRTRRLYLSRSDAKFRRVRNEEELIPVLRAHDFEIVSPGQLTFAEQVSLFSEAAVIAGPAGAAFANLVFAAPNTQVIEMVPPQWLAAFHWMISARAGLTHTILLGSGPVMRGVPDSSARQADLTVPPERLAVLLERLPAMLSR